MSGEQNPTPQRNNTVTFMEADGYLLYWFCDGETSLTQLIHNYIFIERTAIPAYEVLAGCLSRGVKAGIVEVIAQDRFRIRPEWRTRLDRIAARHRVPEDGGIEFTETLVSQEWPVVEENDFIVDQAAYQSAATIVQRAYDDLFRRAGQR